MQEITKFIALDRTEFANNKLCQDYELLVSRIDQLLQQALDTLKSVSARIQKEEKWPYLLTIEEAAEFSGIRIGTLRKRVAKRDSVIPIVMHFGRPLIHRDKFRAALDAQSCSKNKEIPQISNYWKKGRGKDD